MSRKKSPEDPRFTAINDSVCLYCAHVVWIRSRDGRNDDFACGKRVDQEGRVQALSDPFTPDPARRNVVMGCREFKVGSIPAHPAARDELARRNWRTRFLLFDSEATQTGYEFAQRVQDQAEEDGRVTTWGWDKVY